MVRGKCIGVLIQKDFNLVIFSVQITKVNLLCDQGIFEEILKMYFPHCFNRNEHYLVSTEMSTFVSDSITIGFSSQCLHLVSPG